MMYNGTIEFSPATTRNRGLLVQPPISIDWESLAPVAVGEPPPSQLDDHWVILHALPAQCDAGCIETVTALRQVHRAAGRNQARIRLALLLQDPQQSLVQNLLAIYPEFRLLEDPGQALWRTLQDAARSGQAQGAAVGASYLVDPLGNIMMYYAPGSDPNDLKQDLKRLLTWSKLDEST